MSPCWIWVTLPGELLGSPSSLLLAVTPWLLGGPGWKNGLAPAIADRMAFTWSTGSLDFWENSGPNRESATFQWEEWLIHLTDHIWTPKVADPSIGIAQQFHLSSCTLIVWSKDWYLASRVALRRARASRTNDWILASSLLIALTIGNTSGFM